MNILQGTMIAQSAQTLVARIADNTTGAITASNCRDLINAVMIDTGAWSNATAYLVNDVVTYSGSTYVCIVANTNSQPPSANWSAIGGSAAGALLAGNNLSDLASAATARTNLGLGGARTSILSP